MTLPDALAWWASCAVVLTGFVVIGAGCGWWRE